MACFSAYILKNGVKNLPRYTLKEFLILTVNKLLLFLCTARASSQDF